MKILITGTKGYISKSFAAYMDNTHTVSLRDNKWRQMSFRGYDAVLHAAALVHKGESRRNQYDYYIINRDLTDELARKAKADGVKQFVFLSSLSVYGLTTGTITKDTALAPTTNYGRSKLAAESLIAPLADDSFAVAILRPPMVYGPGCPGNLQKLRKLVRIAPFFPDYENARHLISIDSLCAYLGDIIENKKSGIFIPFDPEPVSTRDLAMDIAKEYNKNLRFTKAFNGLISRFMGFGPVGKLFGSLIIEL